MLITPGFATKAYSVSSMIYPLASVMVLAAAWCYEHTGLEILFLFNSVTFLIAAAFETRIRVDESQMQNVGEQYNLKKYMSDFKEGIRYMRGEAGLMAIAAYFTVMTFADNASGTLLLPFFKDTEGLGVERFTFVMAFAVIGRIIGGLRLYKYKFEPSKKFRVALIVYIMLNVIAGSLLYAPMYVMCAMMLVSGLLGVTSYNIRISSTQSYVPNEMRGRFTGAFQMLTTIGNMAGALVAGALAEFLPIRELNAGFYAIAVVAVFLTVYRKRSEVKKIYCVDI